MTNEELHSAFDRLSDLKQQAENAQQRTKDFRTNAGNFLTDAALKFYSALDEMDAEDIRKFGSIISEHTRSLAEELNRLNYKVKTRSEA